MEDLFSVEKKFFVYNLDENKILFKQNEDQKTEIASLTKIMTALLGIEKVPLDTEVIVTAGMLEGLDGFAAVGLSVG